MTQADVQRLLLSPWWSSLRSAEFAIRIFTCDADVRYTNCPHDKIRTHTHTRESYLVGLRPWALRGLSAQLVTYRRTAASRYGPSVQATETEIEIMFITLDGLSLQTTYKNEKEDTQKTEITYNNTHIPSLRRNDQRSIRSFADFRFFYI